MNETNNGDTDVFPKWSLMVLQPKILESLPNVVTTEQDDAETAPPPPVCVCMSAAPYVKVYLMDNGKCVLKRRTRLARKTLDPLYQQQLQFEENPEGKVLQVGTDTLKHTH